MILSAVLCALFPYASIGVIYVLIKGYFPAAFPWEIFSALLYMAELWLIALIAVLLLLRRKERYTPLALARAVMIVKLVQLPAYAGILLLGLGFSLTVCSDDRAQRPARRRCGEPRTGGGHLHEVLRRTAGDLPVHLLRGRRRVDDLVLPPAPREKERGMICKHSAAMATKSPLEKSETAANTELVVSDDVTARISASMQRKSNLLKTMRGAA